MILERLRHRALLIIWAAMASALFATADSSYRQSVEKWRMDYQAELTSDTGWLTVSGLFWLKEGDNRLGSDPANDIVLPPSAPAHVGVLTYHEGKTSVRVDPGIEVLRDGKPVRTAELKPDAREDYLVLGDLTLYIHASGERLALRLRDKNSQLRKNFTGLNWFPINDEYAVSGVYVPYEAPKKLDSENVMGDAIKLTITGYVEFSLKGQSYRLAAGPQSSGKSLFIVFRDLTSGKETYPASRFLDIGPPNGATQGGPVQVDFNKAYNPPCAYNPNTTCPLPLPGNRMKIEIPAGEKLYKHSHGT
jgi:uncharacterized protein (DUF1684 family)